MDQRLRALMNLGRPPDGEAEAEAARVIKALREKGAADLAGTAIGTDLMIEARNRVSERFLTAISLARVKLRKFHEYQRRHGYAHDDGDGVTLSRLVRPLARVGVCCSGSPSELLMCVVPAQVAGVGEIVVAAAAGEDGRVAPAILATLRMLDLREAYRLDGAIAAAALALGQGPIRKVDKVVGRLSAAGAAAGRMLSGRTGFAVSPEAGGLAIVADASANAKFAAMDMLARAEMFDPGPLVLFATERLFAEAVRIEISRCLDAMDKAGRVGANLERGGGIFLCSGIGEAMRAVNLLEPARLQLMTGDNQACLAEVENAGAVFLGAWSPDGSGDVFAGAGLGLPGLGSASFASGIGVGDFVKEMSVVEYGPERLFKTSRHLRELMEGDVFGPLALQERLNLLAGN
ncbi:MAG: histidinol dehydrogenase [Planctomycetota bacterium]|jgi:histidinol dehydrogenase|nr:histidinol dehydrogenase [Planctomycetota bacterium]